MTSDARGRRLLAPKLSTALLVLAFAACAAEPAREPAAATPTFTVDEPSAAEAPQAASASAAPREPPPGGWKDPVAIAQFLTLVHERIHPRFADQALATWDALPSSSPLANPSLLATVEMSFDQSGVLERMALVRSSGLREFDVTVLDIVASSAPFPRPPSDILSSDGHAYVHWDFYRDKVRSCSAAGARPLRRE